jgi:hypothetical protein
VADVVKTRVDLIERAATELGVKTSNTALQDEDYQTIDGLVDPFLLQLSVDSVVNVSDSDEIEAEFFLPLAKLLANVAAPSFGQQESPDVKALQERILRRITAGKPTYQTIKALYY